MNRISSLLTEMGQHKAINRALEIARMTFHVERFLEAVGQPLFTLSLVICMLKLLATTQLN